MADAKPGDLLNFAECRKRFIADYKPLPMKQIPPDTLRKAREKLARRSARARPQVTVGPYDEVYFKGLSALDSDELPTGLSGIARIDE